MRELLVKIIDALGLKFRYGTRKGCIVLHIENDNGSAFVLGNASVDNIDKNIPTDTLTLDEVLEQELDYEFGTTSILEAVVTCEEFASELASMI